MKANVDIGNRADLGIGREAVFRRADNDAGGLRFGRGTLCEAELPKKEHESAMHIDVVRDGEYGRFRMMASEKVQKVLKKLLPIGTETRQPRCAEIKEANVGATLGREHGKLQRAFHVRP